MLACLLVRCFCLFIAVFRPFCCSAWFGFLLFCFSEAFCISILFWSVFAWWFLPLCGLLASGFIGVCHARPVFLFFVFAHHLKNNQWIYMKNIEESPALAKEKKSTQHAIYSGANSGGQKAVQRHPKAEKSCKHQQIRIALTFKDFKCLQNVENTKKYHAMLPIQPPCSDLTRQTNFLQALVGSQPINTCQLCKRAHECKKANENVLHLLFQNPDIFQRKRRKGLKE